MWGKDNVFDEKLRTFCKREKVPATNFSHVTWFDVIISILWKKFKLFRLVGFKWITQKVVKTKRNIG